jgi:putative phosphoribosyl transferase
MHEGWVVIFQDRKEAGEKLAEALQRFASSHPVVLALPRGGVPVAFEVARALGAPLDLVLVRKIGAPFHRELAAAAVVDGDSPELVVNEDVVEQLGITDAYLQAEGKRQIEEIERRRKAYLGGRERVPLEGRTVIVVDDGIATGATMRAALRGVRRGNPSRLVLAVPVAPPDTVDSLRAEVDDVVCLDTPAWFGAIGAFYEDFEQLSDEDVRELLARAQSGGEERGSSGTAPPHASARGGIASRD